MRVDVVGSVEAVVSSRRQVGPADVLGKTGQAPFHFGFRDASAHHHGDRILLQFGFTADSHGNVRFSNQYFFRIDRTVEFN